jgi:uncharacterized protein (TIGR02172 family)
LKLFYDWFELKDIEYEWRISKAIEASGLPVPFVGELIRKNNRHGLIFERVRGVSMLEELLKKPWSVFHYARQMAKLHVKMHASAIQADIPKQRQKLKKKIHQAKVLPAETQTKVLAELEKMPEGSQLCHGDFHPGNIMMAKESAIIIDWIDSTLGNPLADLARTSIIILGSIESDQIQNAWMNILVRIFHRVYLRHYFYLRPDSRSEYQRWLPIVAAARLSENIAELESWLIGQAEMVS